MEYVLSIIGMPEAGLKRAFAPLGHFAAHLHDHFIPNHRNNYHPHILGHRALGLMSGLLVTVKIFTLALLSFGPIAPAFSSAITESNIINLTNESRQEYSLSPLSENSMLDQAAQAKANDMLAKGYFAHNTPDGHTPWDFIVAAGYSYLMAGENLAVNFSQAEDVETAWMNSPGHKANILNKNYEEIGIGISEGQYQGHTAIFVVQEFGTPAAQKVALSDKPTVVQKPTVPAPAKTAVQNTTAQNKDVRGASSASAKVANAPAPAPNPAPAAQTLPVAIQGGNVELSGSEVNITATVTGPAVKVIAYFGQQAAMLLPKSNNLWGATLQADVLSQSNTTLRLEAFGMSGQNGQMQLADFSQNTQTNYNLIGAAPAKMATLFSRSFNPKSAESRFYLLFIAALLTSLALAIGVKRHIQHLPLIANSSFVVILACLLWMGG